MWHLHLLWEGTETQSVLWSEALMIKSQRDQATVGIIIKWLTSCIKMTNAKMKIKCWLFMLGRGWWGLSLIQRRIQGDLLLVESRHGPLQGLAHTNLSRGSGDYKGLFGASVVSFGDGHNAGCLYLFGIESKAACCRWHRVWSMQHGSAVLNSDQQHQHHSPSKDPHDVFSVELMMF